MKTLLRSMFVAGSDQPDLLLRNYIKFLESGLDFESAEDTVIWRFIHDFVQAHNHVPNVNTVSSHFKHIHEDGCLNRAEQLVHLPALTGGDFLRRLEDKAMARRTRRVGELLKEAASITTTGLEVQRGKEKLMRRGPLDAIRHILDKSHEILTPTNGVDLSGEVTGDTEAFRQLYERIEADPLAGIGQHSGLYQMDMALNGAKRYELWIHAAFTGGMKSSLMLNWVYNQAIYFKHDSVVFSLEMPYFQCRNLLYAMHSLHEKFREVRFHMGLQTDPNISVGLPYVHVRDADLHEWHPNARDFLFDHVIPDLQDPKNHYGKMHVEVSDPDKSDFTVADLRSRAEIIFSDIPFATIFVDHVGLMAPRKWVSSTTERLNEVIRDLKRMAMSFNRGSGIAVVALFQINREGYKRALKMKEKNLLPRYNLTDLSYANEAERSADVVTTSWKDDDLAKMCRILLDCLKSRDQKPFDPFLSRVEWSSRRMFTCFDASLSDDQKTAIGDAIDDDVADVLDL